MFNWTINKNLLVISGILDKHSGVLLWANRHKFLKDSTTSIEIQLSEIEKTDSAGLATLIALCKEANKKNLSLKLTHAPKQLREIAKISGVDEILPFE